MAYCAQTDIIKIIPEDTLTQLTDDEGTGQMNAARVAEAIASADATIDSYCATRYAVPFAPAPAVVKKLSVDLAIYDLYSRRVEEIPAARADRYKNAIRVLEGIAKGTITLGLDPAPAPSSEGSSAACNKTSDDRVFTRDKLEGF
jgi:phage gp36-like protein